MLGPSLNWPSKNLILTTMHYNKTSQHLFFIMVCKNSIICNTLTKHIDSDSRQTGTMKTNDQQCGSHKFRT